MTTTEVRDAADGPAPVADVLTVAPRPTNRRVVLAVLAAALAAVLGFAGYTVWQRLQPPPDLTLAQIEDAYGGMVRSDGTNEVSVVDVSKFTDAPLEITPTDCVPLFDTTVSNQWPTGALDGASTYWLNEGGASISLFTVRYPDTAAAAAAYGTVQTALSACDGTQVDFSGPETPGAVAAVLVPAGDADAALAYQLDRDGRQGRYAVHVTQLTNTVTWQYRYESPEEAVTPGQTLDTGRAYDPTPADQLTTGLIAQLRSIQAAVAS